MSVTDYTECEACFEQMYLLDEVVTRSSAWRRDVRNNAVGSWSRNSIILLNLVVHIYVDAYCMSRTIILRDKCNNNSNNNNNNNNNNTQMTTLPII
jgi:hypothetical protein